MTNNHNQYNQIDNNDQVHRRSRSDSVGAFHIDSSSNNDEQQRLVNGDKDYNDDDDDDNDNEGYSHNNSYRSMPPPKTFFVKDHNNCGMHIKTEKLFYHSLIKNPSRRGWIFELVVTHVQHHP